MKMRDYEKEWRYGFDPAEILGERYDTYTGFDCDNYDPYDPFDGDDVSATELDSMDMDS